MGYIMKTKTIFLTLLVTLLSVSNLMAYKNPPVPDTANTADGDGPGDPGGPGGAPETPINENIGLLFGAALVLGVTLIYKNKIKKASV